MSSSRSRLWRAGAAGVLGCAGLCAAPFLTTALLGAGAGAALSRFLWPGSELAAGLGVFGAALWLQQRRARAAEAPSCRIDAGCSGSATPQAGPGRPA
jgi:hypothetical protein